jgi:alpha-galactosidase
MSSQVSFLHSATRPLLTAALLSTLTSFLPACAQVNGVGQRPYRGWSSFSEQTINSSFLTQANIQTQSDALKASGLQQHGFTYINIDSGWQGSFDGNGRPIPNTTTFPNIKALVDHIHANGQKAGIYWIPGIEQPAVDGNYPILGTSYTTQQIVAMPLAQGNAFAGALPNPYHDKIDFTKPGAQAYINSVVALFASWGIDFIKLDGVAPGSDVDSTAIDDRPDVEAWSKAIGQSGRPIWLTISWDLDEDYLSTWQQFANARRIDQDVECEGDCATLTDWPRIVLREYEDVGWEHAAGPNLGWNDMDTLDIGMGALDGLSDTEKQTAVTIWAMANSPLFLGGDLTQLDDFAKAAFSNDELLAVDQSGHPAVQVTGGPQPAWVAEAGDGSLYVALYNLNGLPSKVTVPWTDLGFAQAVRVRDLWNRIDLAAAPGSLTTILPGHGARLLRIYPAGKAPTTFSQSYEAESAVLNGAATVSPCAACSDGAKVSYIGASTTTNSVTFNNVRVEHDGTYRMEVDAMSQGPRALIYTVNGTPATLNMGGGSFNLPQAMTVPVTLKAGLNLITFSNPSQYAPDLDRIVISGDGKEPAPTFTTYEAEGAQLSGSASAGGCSYCSGGAYVGNFGGGTQNAVTFNNVNVSQAGTYQLEVDYTEDGPRSLYVYVNGGSPTELDVNGSSWDSPQFLLLPVQLNAGANTIVFTNPNAGGYAPGLDSITVGPIVNNANLTAAITGKSGLGDLRLWQLKLTNSGLGVATQSTLDSITVASTDSSSGCKATAVLPRALSLGTIPAKDSRKHHRSRGLLPRMRQRQHLCCSRSLLRESGGRCRHAHQHLRNSVARPQDGSWSQVCGGSDSHALSGDLLAPSQSTIFRL